MNLPSEPQAQKKDWPTPSDTPISAGHRQGTDFESSMPTGESNHSILTKIGSQTAPWKSFLGLGIVSIGLHLLALRIPIPAMQPVSKINQPIKVTQLTVLPKPKRLPKKSLLKPTSLPTSVKPKAVGSSPRLQNRAISPAAIISSRPSSPAPVAFTRSPSPVPVVSSSPISKSSAPQPSPSPTPVSEQTPVLEQKPESGSGFRDFPFYPGAKPPDLKNPAYRTPADFKMVLSFFDDAFHDPKQKWHYEVSTDETNQRVYRITKGGETKFLSVFSKKTQGTVYTLADQPTTEEALRKEEEKMSTSFDQFGKL